MKLAPSPVHLSHFHRLVSAYRTTPETVKWLEDHIRESVDEAASSGDRVIVEQDCLEHIFVVYPSGNVALYREVGLYRIED